MKTIRYFVIFFTVVVSLYPQSSSTTGKIRGVVTDAQTGTSLVGANVIIEDSNIGAATNNNGQFVIPNLSAGSYSVLVTYMGYRTKNIQEVEVFPGQSVNLDIELQPGSLQGETVEVVAEARRQVVDVKEAASEEKLSTQEITSLPVSNVQGLLANTAGVVETEGGRDQGIHMRGGRSGEVAYYVDGVKINDPVDNYASLDIDKYSIQQVKIKLSGMDAEYGDVMSGIVDIIIKEGRQDRLSLAYRYEGDNLPAMVDEGVDFGYRKQYFSINGPIPFTKGRLTYFVSATNKKSDDRRPSIVEKSHNGNERFEGIGKFVYRPKNLNFKVELSTDIGRENSDIYNHSISRGDWLQSYYTMDEGHNRASLKLSGTLSQNTAWSLLLSYYNRYEKFASGEGRKYNEFKYLSKTLDWVNDAAGNGWYDPKTREWSDLIKPNGSAAIRENYKAPDGTPLGESDLETQAFYLYYANRGYYNVLDGSWTSNENKMNALNARYHDANWYYIPSQLPEYAENYDPNDHTVHQQIFDIDEYNDYHYMTEDKKDENILMGYNGDMHTGWGRDRDLFNVFTYGPGRPRYHDQSISRRKMKFLLNSQWNLYNSVNTGFEISSTNMDYTDIQFANQKPYYDAYNVEPVKAGAWAQNKLEYEDLILNFGLRWDYFHSHSKAIFDAQNLDPGSDGLVDEEEEGYDPNTNPDPNNDNFDPITNPDGTEGDGEVDRKKATAKMKLSPRFGINFAVSDRSSLFANFCHFFQTPQYGEIFQNVMADFSTGYPLAGNPDIEPEKTRYYEFGLKHRITDEVGLKIAAYYKDQTNRLSTRIYNTMYENNYVKVTEMVPVDFATIKGLEFKLKLRNYKGIGGEISYEFLDAQGSGSSSREFYYMYILSDESPTPAKEYPLEFDITHQLRTKLYYVIEEGPEIFGIHPLRNSFVNAYSLLRTGRPYTPTDSRGNPLELNSKRMPGHFTVDMRFEKYLGFISLYLDVRNLLNIEKIVDVYKYSGKPDDTGINPKYEPAFYNWYVGKEDPRTGKTIQSAEEAYDAHIALRKEYYKNPANYGSPRLIRFGIGFHL